MHSCTIYGLSVASPMQFFGPSPISRVATDVIVRYDSVELQLTESEIVVSGPNYRVTPQGIFFFWDNIGTFLVRDGHEIIVDPTPDVDELLLRKTILNDIFAALLYQRGLLVLHASAAAIDGQAVLFLGKSQSGKSTLALALHTHGNQLVADDVAAITVEERTSTIVPAYPEISVWPDTLTAFSLHAATLRPRARNTTKRMVPIGQRFANAKLPVTHVCVLDKGSGSAVELLSPSEAMAAILDQSYCYRLLTKEGIINHLSQCARLVATTEAIRVQTPHSLNDLPTLGALIEDTVKREHSLDSDAYAYAR